MEGHLKSCSTQKKHPPQMPPSPKGVKITVCVQLHMLCSIHPCPPCNQPQYRFNVSWRNASSTAMASRRGLTFTHCEHICSLQYCTDMATKEYLREEVLPEMVHLKFLGESKKATCIKRLNYAQAAHREGSLCWGVIWGKLKALLFFSPWANFTLLQLPSEGICNVKFLSKHMALPLCQTKNVMCAQKHK